MTWNNIRIGSVPMTHMCAFLIITGEYVLIEGGFTK